MTLAKARAEANKAFKTAEEAVLKNREGQWPHAEGISTRTAASYLIAWFWDIRRQLDVKDKIAFLAWFEKKHDALGKKLQSPHLLRQHIK